MMLRPSHVVLLGVLVSALSLSGCAALPREAPLGSSTQSPTVNPSGARISLIHLSDAPNPLPQQHPATLAGAKNEWVGFTIELSNIPAGNARRVFQLRISSPYQSESGLSIGVEHFRAYQVLSMPLDMNRAGYVRHTGQRASLREVPRALLPIPLEKGRMNLSALRDPQDPTNPLSKVGTHDAVLLWIDLHIPALTRAGKYIGAIDMIESDGRRALASLTMNLNVYDFVLPDERHLNLVGELSWEGLQRLFAGQFEAITDRLLNRTDPRYADAIRTLDQLMILAQAHRAQLVVPRLQPTVKWPGGRLPQIFWEDYDSVVTPWLNGQLFADRVPLGYWPLPAVNGLFNYDQKSQTDYWALAASHFEQKDWLSRSSVFLEKPTPGRANTRESLILSAEAAAILAAHPRIRVCVPLEDDQIQFATANNPKLISNDSTSRLITANPGIVFQTPMQSWPGATVRPPRWLRTDLVGLVPYVGAGGDEHDVRMWAWTAALPLPPPPLGVEYGPVQFVRFPGVLPKTSSPREPADPNDLIWFYPGSWFGVEAPLPTVQLKWLRQAQQDAEYLYLARRRGERLNALYMARIITKPVELQPGQEPDPTYGLMSGTADPKAWSEARALLAQRILLREPGQSVDKQQEFNLNLQTLRWSEPQERPVILGRITHWTWDPLAGPAIHLRLALDVYNASDSTPSDNSLEYTPPLPSGWIVQPQAVKVPTLGTYHVRRFALDAHVDTNRIRNTDRTAVKITYTNGFTKRTSSPKMIIPVAATDRREGRLRIDGLLEDWSAEDLVHDGPLLKLLDRPSLQAQQLVAASSNSSIFSGWADENFYLAFKVSGLSDSASRFVRNFVHYQFRRAWGEDLVQILIQPVYSDNSVGPIMHVVCKPNGHWVERKMDPRGSADPWQALEGSGVRYAATMDGADWRGEIAIPWKALSDSPGGTPVLLRFNFTHHRSDIGESASWAGPIDFGRDDAFTGVLFLRDEPSPGVANW